MKRHPGDEGNPYFECEECGSIYRHLSSCPVLWRENVDKRLQVLEEIYANILSKTEIDDKTR